jgi:hypothetical protein
VKDLIPISSGRGGSEGVRPIQASNNNPAETRMIILIL